MRNSASPWVTCVVLLACVTAAHALDCSKIADCNKEKKLTCLKSDGKGCVAEEKGGNCGKGTKGKCAKFASGRGSSPSPSPSASGSWDEGSSSPSPTNCKNGKRQPGCTEHDVNKACVNKDFQACKSKRNAAGYSIKEGVVKRCANGKKNKAGSNQDGGDSHCGHSCDVQSICKDGSSNQELPCVGDERNMLFCKALKEGAKGYIIKAGLIIKHAPERRQVESGSGSGSWNGDWFQKSPPPPPPHALDCSKIADCNKEKKLTCLKVDGKSCVAEEKGGNCRSGYRKCAKFASGGGSSPSPSGSWGGDAKPQATRLSLVSSNDAKNIIAERRLIRPAGWDAKRNVAKANNVVTLHIVAEEFVQTPHVVFSSGNGSISDSSVNCTDEDASHQERANKAWSCKFITHRSDTEGLVTFRVVLTDAAGNQGGPWSYVTDGTSVIVDTTAPTLATVSINSSNNAKAAIAAGKMQLPQGWDKNRNVAIKNDVVTLTVKASEFIHVPICYFKAGGKPVKDRRIRYNDEDTSSQAKANKIWTCKYTAHPDDAKGIVSFIVHFKDVAGNRGIPVVNVTDGSSVIADKIGPTVPEPEPEPEPQPEPEPYSHCTAADADKNGRVNIEGK